MLVKLIAADAVLVNRSDSDTAAADLRMTDLPRPQSAPAYRLSYNIHNADLSGEGGARTLDLGIADAEVGLSPSRAETASQFSCANCASDLRKVRRRRHCLADGDGS
jgi:hypothetical protein